MLTYQSIKTGKILPGKIKLKGFLDSNVKSLSESTILVISSKVLSLIAGSYKNPDENLEHLIREEAEYISKKKNNINKYLTIKHHAFISSGGIDESNGAGKLVMLPKKPFKTAREIHTYLTLKFGIKSLGIIITDSHSIPLRRGAIGISIGFWGFSPLHDYLGEKDIFGREFVYEKANLVDQLAAGANLAMGEGSEQTPIVKISGANMIRFGKNSPTKSEINFFLLTPKKDIYHLLYEGKLK